MVAMIFGSYILGNVVYDLFDCGVANILEVQTLRHGANVFNYLSIRVQGGDPQHGGKSDGSTKGWKAHDIENYFYLFKAKEFKVWENKDQLSLSKIGYITVSVFEFQNMGSRFLARFHTFLSGYNFTSGKLLPDSSPCKKTIRIFLSIFSGIFHLAVTPTVRFRFARIDPSRLENDPKYGESAYRTKQLVEAWRIGLLGSICGGINSDWFARVKAEPLTLLLGVVQVTCALAFVILCVNVVVANPYLLIPGLAGALLC